MKKTMFVFAVLAMFGCAKEETPSAPAPGAAAAAAAPKAETKPAAAEAPKEETKPAVAAVAPAAQKGLEAGQVIAGYLKDTRDEAQCGALPVPEAEKTKYDAAKLAEVAKMMKSEVVTSCPSDNVVGTCKMMGMLVNYAGPKYNTESAQKHCGENRGKWIE